MKSKKIIKKKPKVINKFEDFGLLTRLREEALKAPNEGTALRYDDNKPRMDLLSPIALEGIAKVLAYGSIKYPEENWRGGMKWKRCIGSLLRHTFKFMSGEDLDPESGQPHIYHVATNAMFLCEYFTTHKELDDRYKK